MCKNSHEFFTIPANADLLSGNAICRKLGGQLSEEKGNRPHLISLQPSHMHTCAHTVLRMPATTA
jgi:hypothetical protein